MALKIVDSDIDYAKSTMAYPMSKDPTPMFVDNGDIDYAKSTGAYPMYDGTPGVAADRVVEHLDAPVEAQFATPGPMSHGPEEIVTAQRKALGLSADPSGDSDAGYEARPSTVPVAGADGVDREPAETKVVTPPQKRARRGTGGAEGK